MFNLHKYTNINPKEAKYWYILVMMCENLTEKSIKTGYNGNSLVSRGNLGTLNVSLINLRKTAKVNL